MTHVMSVRLDDETERQLGELAKGKASRSAAIADAIHQAYRELEHARLRAESRALANDPDDLAEIRAVRADLDAISAW